MTLPANISNLVNSIEQASEKIDSGDAQFLKMQKDGVWVYGSDEVEPEATSLWAINTNAIMMGFIAWGKEKTPDEGNVVGEEMACVTDPAIIKSSLPTVNGEWKPQFAIQLKCVEGEDHGTDCVYKANSQGAMKEFKRVLNEIVKRAKTGSDELVPLVELDSSHYKHTTYGKIYTPQLAIVEWADFAGLGKATEAAEEPAAVAEEPAEVAEEEPAAVVEVAEEEPAAEKPKRKRRSRKSA